MALIDLFRKFGIGAYPAKFKVGDQVQHINGGPLMIVESIHPIHKSKTCMLSCKWYDSETQETRINLFKEDQLKSFDWYNPN